MNTKLNVIKCSKLIDIEVQIEWQDNFRASKKGHPSHGDAFLILETDVSMQDTEQKVAATKPLLH